MGEAATREKQAIARLLRYYRPGAGRWLPATGAAWQLALAIEAVATAYSRTGDPSYRIALETWHRRQAGRRSRFFDDDGWYVNAWLRAYEVTGDDRFRRTARAGFADLIAGWDDTCGGGLWWNQDRTYKNAITTALFTLAAARLGRLDDDSDGYADWARRAWTWFDGVGLINADHLVNDGLDNCRNNGGPLWTYNQGVIISALVELFQLAGSQEYLGRAHQIATAATTRLVGPDGILREFNEPDCDRDQEIFKGVLAQGLGRLCRADPSDSAAQRTFLYANADAVWRQRWRQADRGFGLDWSGAPGRVTAATHASATLLLGEVALLEP